MELWRVVQIWKHGGLEVWRSGRVGMEARMSGELEVVQCWQWSYPNLYWTTSPKLRVPPQRYSLGIQGTTVSVDGNYPT